MSVDADHESIGVLWVGESMEQPPVSIFDCCGGKGHKSGFERDGVAPPLRRRWHFILKASR